MAKIERGIYVSISSGEIETAEVHDNRIRADERRKFAEWFKRSNYYLCYSDTIDDVLAEYEKEQKK